MTATSKPSIAAQLLKLRDDLGLLEVRLNTERAKIEADRLLLEGVPATSPMHAMVDDRVTALNEIGTDFKTAQSAHQDACTATLNRDLPNVQRLMVAADSAYTTASDNHKRYVDTCNGVPAQPTPAAPATSAPPQPAPAPSPAPTQAVKAAAPTPPPTPSSEEPDWAKALKKSVADCQAEHQRMQRLIDAGLPKEFVDVLTKLTPDELRSRLTSRAQFTDDEVIAVRAILKLLNERGGVNTLGNALRAGNWFDRVTWSRHKPAH